VVETVNNKWGLTWEKSVWVAYGGMETCQMLMEIMLWNYAWISIVSKTALFTKY